MKIIPAIGSSFSPQLMRSVSILRMSAASLTQFLSQHNNPCLRAAHLPPQTDIDDSDIRTYLREECRQTPAPPGQRDLLEWLIECVDDNGFIELPEPLPLPAQTVAAAIHHLQSLAPAGAIARSAQERQLLLLQQTSPSAVRDQAENLLTRHWQWVRRKRWDQLPKRNLTAALTLIDSLPPANIPGGCAAPSIPDVMFVKQLGLWRALPAAGADIKAGRVKADDSTANDWRSAGEIAAAVTARRRWILTAAQYAADHQSGFFDYNAAALRPLPMKKSAQELKISLPMLSHIISGKRAIFSSDEFPLKYLFGAHTGSAVIQYKIRKMLASENLRHPLSDQQLCRLLSQQGVSLARRTVTKHRQFAGFAAAARRKHPEH